MIIQIIASSITKESSNINVKYPFFTKEKKVDSVQSG